jgi:hypothetical protein
MISHVELENGRTITVILPEWIKGLDQLDFYQNLQRQVFLKKLVCSIHPLAGSPDGLDTCHNKQDNNGGAEGK